MKHVPIKDFVIGKGQPLAICAGPCVIESEEHCFSCAKELKAMFRTAGIPLIFKSSYDKANRTSGGSFRGLGVHEGLRILKRIQDELDLPIVTDVHSAEEATLAGAICDVIQIPAFLCRQTDLLIAAGESGAVVQVKKGQFLAPWDMQYVVDKITSTGNQKIILVDRGTCFGYNTLVSDMRAIPIMQTFGFPVCFDATHSVQRPGAGAGVSGGERQFVPVLARAALAAGANVLFIEAHPKPEEAKSDAASMLAFSDLPKLLSEFKQLYNLVNGF